MYIFNKKNLYFIYAIQIPIQNPIFVGFVLRKRGKSVGAASREATDCLRSFTIRLNRIAESNATGGTTGRRGHVEK